MTSYVKMEQIRIPEKKIIRRFIFAVKLVWYVL